jgi:hypothetical protein
MAWLESSRPATTFRFRRGDRLVAADLAWWGGSRCVRRWPRCCRCCHVHRGHMGPTRALSGLARRTQPSQATTKVDSLQVGSAEHVAMNRVLAFSQQQSITPRSAIDQNSKDPFQHEYLLGKGPFTWEPPIGIEPMTYALRGGLGSSTGVHGSHPILFRRAGAGGLVPTPRTLGVSPLLGCYGSDVPLIPWSLFLAGVRAWFQPACRGGAARGSTGRGTVFLPPGRRCGALVQRKPGANTVTSGFPVKVCLVAAVWANFGRAFCTRSECRWWPGRLRVCR